MSEPDLRRTSADELARLLGVHADAQPAWSVADLAAIWRHQMQTALVVDLQHLDPRLPSTLGDADRQGGPSITTFGDLIAHSAPPVAALQLVKRFAKEQGAAETPLLPRELFAALYLAAICAARVRCGQEITSTAKHELRSHLQWGVSQSWLDDATLALLREGLTLLTE